MLHATAIAERSAEAGYPLAMTTGSRMLDRDGAPYLSLLGRRELEPERWTFDQRVIEALRTENDSHPGGYGGDPHTRQAAIIASARRATGWRIDVPDGYVTIGDPHHYGDCRHTIVVHGPAADRMAADKRARWHEFVGVADGYVTFPASRLMDAIADAGALRTMAGELDDGTAWASTFGLVFVVTADYRPRSGSGGIIHIGSCSRRLQKGKWSTWTLSG